MQGAPDDRFSSNDLKLVRHNPWMVALAASPALLSVGSILGGILVSPGFFVTILHCLIFALAMLIYVLRTRPRPRYAPVEVHADREALAVGEERVPREALRDGLVVPARSDRGPQVVLRRKGAFKPSIRLAVHDRAEGRRLLRALGFDASQTVARFRAMSRALGERRHMFYALGGFFLGLAVFAATGVITATTHSAAWIGLGAVPLAFGYIGMIASFLAPTTIIAGADGLMIQWLFWKRFVRFGDILTVARYESGWGRSNRKGLTVVLQSGEQITLPISQDAEAVAIVEERIQEAMETYRRGDAEGKAALVRRNGREIGEWVTQLRALGAGSNADLRTAPLPRDALFRIVESPTAEAADRAAAAVALGRDLDDEGKVRLRSAASATAAPKLRIAIEKAAGDADDEALREALAALEEEQGEVKRLS
ncbi:MAG: hypothetical protein U0359_27610 [Byssovorax sp.]